MSDSDQRYRDQLEKQRSERRIRNERVRRQYNIGTRNKSSGIPLPTAPGPAPIQREPGTVIEFPRRRAVIPLPPSLGTTFRPAGGINEQEPGMAELWKKTPPGGGSGGPDGSGPPPSVS